MCSGRTHPVFVIDLKAESCRVRTVRVAWVWTQNEVGAERRGSLSDILGGVAAAGVEADGQTHGAEEQKERETGRTHSQSQLRFASDSMAAAGTELERTGCRCASLRLRLVTRRIVIGENIGARTAVRDALMGLGALCCLRSDASLVRGSPLAHLSRRTGLDTESNGTL